MSKTVSATLDKLYADRVSGKVEDRWAARHLEAWSSPIGVERGIVGLVGGLDCYAEAHLSKFAVKIGTDSFLGPAFQQIAESILTLLNGDLGRFDGGTLDALVRAICAEHGVELDQ